MNPYHRITDFHRSRLRGVGSSDIPTLAGLNKRYFNAYRWTETGVEERLPQTTRTLWLEKTGRVVQIEDPKKAQRLKWGNVLEPLVAREYIEAHFGPEAAHDFYRNATRAEPVSSGPFKVKTEAFHPERGYCLAHADLLVHGGESMPMTCPRCGSRDDFPVGVAIECSNSCGQIITAPDGHLVEIKTSGFMAGKRKDANPGGGYDPDDLSQFGIPDKVFMQVQWQLYCYGIETATVAVLIDTADYREYGPVVFDPKHVSQSIALAEAFWGLVERDIEPSPETWDDVVSAFTRLENTTAMISGEAEIEARRIIARGADLKAKKKELDDELEDIKAALGILAGENAVLVASDGDTLAKLYTRSRESLSLPLADIAKKQKAGAELTPQDQEILAIDARLRALGCYKTSETWREVRY